MERFTSALTRARAKTYRPAARSERNETSVGVSSWLATFLDEEMLRRNDVRVADAHALAEDLPWKSGREVAREVGGRYLLRYLLADQLRLFVAGSSDVHYVTPTPYAPEEAPALLAMPGPDQPRPYALVLDPARIPSLWGPQRILGAPGIQYVLREGFPQEAVVVPGRDDAGWEIAVR
jgi:hypothetical protein